MRSFQISKALFAVCATVLLAACGGDGVSGPVNANLAGSWSYSASNLSGGGFNCFVSGTTMVISQTAAGFTGSYSGGILSCSYQGGTSTNSSAGTGSVSSGTVSVNAVAFNFDTSDWANTGSVSGNTISGTTVVRIVSGSSVVFLNGNFAAIRN
jgi:hypothetical protein